VFSYDTGATHVLAALVKKLSGQNLLEYLRPRLLDPLALGKMSSAGNDPMGIAQGGSGLNCRPIELLKFGLCYLQGGMFEGKQIIPAWYVREATARQVDNTLATMRLEGQQGYGYFFWRTQNNGFTCYGAGGQFVFCLPEQELVLVTTANARRYETTISASSMCFGIPSIPRFRRRPSH
jgi:CubicO group peptidase (beta-lactamase class C family)